MAPVRNARVLFNSVPKDYPVPGETTVYDSSQEIDLKHVPLNGGILIKVLVLGIDPYFRGLMRDLDLPEGFSSYALGQPLRSWGIGLVLRSEIAGVEEGSHVRGPDLPHQEYVVAPTLGTLEVIERDPRLNWSVYVGAAGMPGESAHMGWREFSRAKKGEVVFITAGASAVGSLVIQLAKQDGTRVITSAGSDDKVQFMKKLGADVAFNYKTTDVREVLAKEGPIDIYWDNVGGDTLDAAMEHANRLARFIECGHISGYNNSTGILPMKNPFLIVFKSLSMHGFITPDLKTKYQDAFQTEVVHKLAEGKLKFAEDVAWGLDKVGDVILAVQKGTTTGKAVVIVADG